MKRKADDAAFNELSDSAKRAKVENLAIVRRKCMESEDMVRHIAKFMGGNDLNAWATTSRALHFDRLLASTRRLLFKFRAYELQLGRGKEAKWWDKTNYSRQYELVWSAEDGKVPLAIRHSGNAIARYCDIQRVKINHRKLQLEVFFNRDGYRGSFEVSHKNRDDFMNSVQCYYDWVKHCEQQHKKRLAKASATAD